MKEFDYETPFTSAEIPINKLKENNCFRIIDGRPILVDMPSYKDWCKLHHIPPGPSARIVYKDSKYKTPTLLRVVQFIFDDKIQEAAKLLNTLATKEKKKYGFEY